MSAGGKGEWDAGPDSHVPPSHRFQREIPNADDLC